MLVVAFGVVVGVVVGVVGGVVVCWYFFPIYAEGVISFNQGRTGKGWECDLVR